MKGALIMGIIFLPTLFVNEGTQWILYPLAFIWFPLGYPFVSIFVYHQLGATGTGMTIGSMTPEQKIIGLLIILIVYVILGGILGGIYGQFKKQNHSNQK